MTGADISRLPATKLPGADTNSVKKSNDKANFDFGNIMMQKEQTALRELNVSDSKNSLKLVMSKKSSVQVNIKVDLTKADTNVKAKETSNVGDSNAFKADAKNNSTESKLDSKFGQDRAGESNQIQKNDEVNTDDVSTMKEEIVSEIKEILKEDLGITDDVIENIMALLQMNYQDLFDQDNLLQFVGALNGDANPAALLLVDGLKEVLSDLKSLEQTIDLSVFESENVEVSVDVDSVLDGTEKTEAFSDVLNQTIETNSTDKDISGGEEETKVEVLDMRTTPKESTNTTLVEDAEAESITGVENPLLSAEGSKEQNAKNEMGGKKENLFSGQNKTNVTPKEASQPNATPQPTVTVNAEATHIEVTTASYQTTRVDVSTMIDKIVQNARVTLTDSTNTMEMILNPEELGKIFMSVTEKDGSIKARILAENETVKTALETQLVLLQDKFKAQGMKVDSVEISVGTHEFKENQEESQALDMGMQDGNHNASHEDEASEKASNLHRIDLNNLDSLQGLMTEEEMLTAKIMKDQGNTVSYQV